MKYSILIPTLNEEKYIGILLQSLTEQTLKDFEVIVCDGKSEDKTEHEVAKFKNKLDIHFVKAPKRGASFQRNYAAKNSHSDRLVFFDADVTVEPDFLNKIDAYLETHEADILTSWNVPISEKRFDEFMYWFFNQFYLEPMKNIKPAVVGAFLYVNKKAFDKVGGFSEEIVLAEDFDLAKRLFKAGFKYALLKDPPIKFSVRRLEKEGRASFIWKNIRAAFYYHIKGPMKAGVFKHEFGNFND